MMVIVLWEKENFYNLFARSLIMFLSGLILHKMTPTPDLVTCSDAGIRKQLEQVINYLLLFKMVLCSKLSRLVFTHSHF